MTWNLHLTNRVISCRPEVFLTPKFGDKRLPWLSYGPIRSGPIVFDRTTSDTTIHVNSFDRIAVVLGLGL